eukprot:scaffold672626_cov90-Attheya_sp.AAC.2
MAHSGYKGTLSSVLLPWCHIRCIKERDWEAMSGSMDRIIKVESSKKDCKGNITMTQENTKILSLTHEWILNATNEHDGSDLTTIQEMTVQGSITMVYMGMLDEREIPPETLSLLLSHTANSHGLLQPSCHKVQTEEKKTIFFQLSLQMLPNNR